MLFSKIGSFFKMLETQKLFVGISSNCLYSIRTSICIRNCNKNWGVISEPMFGKNHRLYSPCFFRKLACFLNA